MINVCIAGLTGWTGKAIATAVQQADDLDLTSGVSEGWSPRRNRLERADGE
jgi:dihydrodipicolinate reductase